MLNLNTKEFLLVDITKIIFILVDINKICLGWQTFPWDSDALSLTTYLSTTVLCTRQRIIRCTVNVCVTWTQLPISGVAYCTLWRHKTFLLTCAILFAFSQASSYISSLKQNNIKRYIYNFSVINYKYAQFPQLINYNKIWTPEYGHNYCHIHALLHSSSFKCIAQPFWMRFLWFLHLARQVTTLFYILHKVKQLLVIRSGEQHSNFKTKQNNNNKI